ncbi:phosphopantetheine-binding protein [Streptomyces sp. AC550_RSS872]|uniref:phosphopantetheine-binding protein n=1 Tax=Streptomyces sp. AC550_RSS872 TaxID=2823689 RepID=UPI0020B75EFD|nr:phosphopantetheine-binding protein [Streptomyces sp. AC550_RSS872]
MGAEGLVPEEDTAEAQMLRRLFAEILGVGSVGPDDSFIALGGDSVTMLRLVTRAREAGLEIGIEDVFESGTVGRLAAVARAAGPPAAVEPSADMTLPSQEELDDIAAEMRG